MGIGPRNRSHFDTVRRRGGGQKKALVKARGRWETRPVPSPHITTSPSPAEHRRHARVAASWPVTVQTGDRLLHLHAVNVSALGVKVSLDEPWAQPIVGLPVERALVAGSIGDEQSKFNLNNLVDGTRASAPDVWAAGDCANVTWADGSRRPEQLWYTARDQGRVAGLSMLGDGALYRRGTWYNSAKFFDLEYTTAGWVPVRLDWDNTPLDPGPDVSDWLQRSPGRFDSQRIVCKGGSGGTGESPQLDERARDSLPCERKTCARGSAGARCCPRGGAGGTAR